MIRLKGSCTVEAVYIMSTTLFALATVFSAAFHLKDKTQDIMKLHTQVEFLRHQEEFQDNKVTRLAAGNGWQLEITASVYDPETWMRMISLIERRALGDGD